MDIDTEPTDEDFIPFTPVVTRTRHDGWTEARQRAFIRALTRISAVAAAAKSVGKTARSAYRLRERPGAESFAEAWDIALEIGLTNVRDNAIERALKGEVVPRFYRGKQVGLVHRQNLRLMIAVLTGLNQDIQEQRWEKQRVRRYRATIRIEELQRREKEAIAEAERRLEAAEARRDSLPPVDDDEAAPPARIVQRAPPRIRLL